MTIAVTGSTGDLGRRVVRHLTSTGTPMRLLVRDAARAPALPGAEVVTASYDDVEGMTAALRGTSTLFFVSAHEAPDRTALHRGVVRAAAAAGVGRVVYTSFMGAAPQASFPYARDHAHTERAIRDAGLRLTALRNSLYADLVPLLVGADGAIRGPAATGRCAFVAREDVARLAAAVLRDETHADRVYDVSGAEPIDLAEAARLLGVATGCRIRYKEESLDQAWASRAGAPEWEIEGWIGSYLAIASGELAITSHTVEAVTGRRPWTFAEYLAAEPQAYAHLRG